MRNIRRNTKVFLIILFIFLILPVAVRATDDISVQGNFIPCGEYDSGGLDECDFYDLIRLVQNVLNWIVLISFPVAIITFAWAGFLLLTTGVVDKRTEAKKMLWSVVIGFAIILAAWLIVRTIVNTLLAPNIGNQFINL